MDFFLQQAELNQQEYIIATYYIESATTLKDAAWNLAIGQSVGNPNIRNRWETDALFERHSCRILHAESELAGNKGEVKIAFPVVNINVKEDGISQLLVQVMGGQLDIDIFTKCHLLHIEFPEEVLREFAGPRYGITGVRNFTGVYDKPILGGIIKPKTGMPPEVLLEMVQELVEGGVNFIKEDEIMSDPLFCSLEERLPPIVEYLQKKQVIYAACITSDPPYLLERVKRVHELGGNAVHVNFWSGLGAYKAIRELDLPLFLFFQKSGDKILTNESHDFHISWHVICELAGLMGVDFIHAGMWGGYSTESDDNLKDTLKILHKHDVVPSLSCGMHPGLIEAINTRFGIDYMANVGGAIHGHPEGTLAGVKAMRQAIDKCPSEEYQHAIDKWGKVD